MNNKNIRKIIYLLFSFGGFIFLAKIHQFNALSYLFGMISVYLSRWCYRG